MRKRFLTVLISIAALSASGIGVYLLLRCWATPWLVWFGLSALFAAVAARRQKIAIAALLVVLLTLFLYNGVLARQPGLSCTCLPGDKDCDQQCPVGHCCCRGECTPNSDPCCQSGSDAPPSISGEVLCGQWGNGSWCRQNARLKLTASDPQGYAVTIRGKLNNVPFNCGTTTSCILALPQGTGTAHYTATASNSGMTASGSTTWAYDPNPPTLTDAVTGIAGLNGWYISPVTDQASASDSISGLAYVQCRLDGGGWIEGQCTVTSDGIHTVDFRALDRAGNVASLTRTVSVDQTPPMYSTSISGTAGNSPWYVSPATITVSASDATSGVGRVEYNQNGAGWQVGSSVVSNEGVNTIEIRVTDNAGNVSSGSLTVYVDTTSPTLTDVIRGTAGNSPWYVSPVTVDISGSDATSGLANVVLTVDGAPAASPITLDDGVHAVSATATDNAGNTSTLERTIHVDTRPPQINGELSGTAGENGWYVSPVTVSASASDPEPGSGLQTLTYALNGGAWAAYAGPLTVVDDGAHTLTFRAADAAGHTAETSLNVRVDTTPPVFSFSPSGTPGNNGWYVSDVLLNIAASDATSGVMSVENNDNGAGWSAGDSVTLHDGQHTVQARVIDNAGNAATGATQVKVDTLPPVLSLVLNGVQEKDHYITEVMAQLFVKDETSGVARTLVTQDGSAIALPVMISQGTHNVYYEAEDVAGNLASRVQAVTVALPVTPTPQPTEAPKLVLVLPTIFFVPTQPAPTPTPIIQVTPEPTQPAPQAKVFAPLTVGALLLFGAFSLLFDPRPAAWRRIVRSAQPYMTYMTWRYDDRFHGSSACALNHHHHHPGGNMEV